MHKLLADALGGRDIEDLTSDEFAEIMADLVRKHGPIFFSNDGMIIGNRDRPGNGVTNNRHPCGHTP